MRTFAKLYKVNLLEELNYKSVFISGIICQFAFAIIYIVLYRAFYESGIPQNFDIYQMSSYVCLNQAFFAMFIYHDINKTKITQKILNGDVCYQLLKPINLYDYWFGENISRGMSMATLRCMPIIAVALLLPKGYGLMLPNSFATFALFLLALILGCVLINAVKMFAYICVLYTMDNKGVFALFISICSLLAGSVIPIPMMPDGLQKILNFMPFRYASDLTFRIYIGNIGLTDGLIQIGIQVVWIIALVIIGRLILTAKSKKLVVQGG